MSSLSGLAAIGFLAAGCQSGLHAAGEPAGRGNSPPDDAGPSPVGPTDAAPAVDEGSPSVGPKDAINVFTRSYDNQRTGVNPAEQLLAPSLITPERFGRLFQLAVDDEVYAQPLYASGVTIAGTKHNVLYVATNNNTVYAFDADKAGDPLWQRNFNGAGTATKKTDVGQSCQPYLDFTANIGIVGTPVIDGATQTLYFVTRTIEGLAFVQRLHAIDIASGDERPASPQTITALSPGMGDDTNGQGMVVFNPKTENQRAALGLSGGTVYVSWASFCDTSPFHGWTIAFDATTLQPTGIANLTPNGHQGGIWMGGGGPAFDDQGNVFVVTGNGSSDGVTNFGQSLVKLGARRLNRLDFFTPSNADQLNAFDLDFGLAGPSFLPGTNLIAAGSKEGKVYLLDSHNLGHTATDDLQILQVLHAVDLEPRPNATHHLHGSNVIWNGPAKTAIYVWGENDFLRAYQFDAVGRRFQSPAFAVSAPLLPQGMPGGMMSLSANGTTPHTGILWVTASKGGDANRGTVPGLLRAFDAENLRLLWDSSAPADDMLTLAKFNPPVVANGKVYVGSFSNVISVYGLRPATALATPTINDGQVLSLKNPSAHLCLNVPGDTAIGRAPLNLMECSGNGGQVWQANDKGGGQWELRRNDTALCLATPSTVAGGTLQQQTCDGSPAQRFTLGEAAGGLQLRAAQGGLCLDVVAASNPGSVQLNPCRDVDSQTFIPLSPQLRNYNADLCLDVPNSTLTSPAPVQLWICNNSGAQVWQTNNKADGTIEIRRGSTGLCLAVAAEKPAANQVIVQATCDGSSSQAWVSEPISGGSQLRLIGSNQCIDVPMSTTAPGTPLRLWDCNRSDAQRFGL